MLHEFLLMVTAALVWIARTDDLRHPLEYLLCLADGMVKEFGMLADELFVERILFDCPAPRDKFRVLSLDSCYLAHQFNYLNASGFYL